MFFWHFRALSCSSGGEDEAGRHGGGGRVHLEQRGAAVRADLHGAGREGRLERCRGGMGMGDGMGSDFFPDLLGGLSRLNLKKWGILGKNVDVFAPDLVSTLVIKHPELNGGCDRQSSNWGNVLRHAGHA